MIYLLGEYVPVVFDFPREDVVPVYAFDPFGIIIYAVISAALSYAASLLMQKDKPKAPNDDTQATRATRGVRLPMVFGRRVVGATVAWAGRVDAKDSNTYGKRYYEAALHLLCVGEVDKLHAIWDGDNKRIWLRKNDFRRSLKKSAGTYFGTNYSNFDGVTPTDGTKTRYTLMTKDNDSAFEIFWGADNQDRLDMSPAASGENATVDEDETAVAKKRKRARRLYKNDVGFRSAWPGHAYVFWDRYHIPGSPSWPDLRYEITCLHDSLSPYQTEIAHPSGNAKNDGINPAHIIYVLLTQPYPKGCGIDVANIDTDSLQALSNLMVSEGLGMNLVLEEGEDVGEKIDIILSDVGAFMAQQGDKLTFYTVRDAGPYITLDDDLLQSPLPTVESNLGEKRATRYIFSYTDRKDRFRTSDLLIDEDHYSDDVGGHREDSVRIETVTNSYTATQVADRRSMEAAGRVQSVTIHVGRAARHLMPGMTLDIPNIGTVVVLSNTPSLESPTAVLKGYIDKTAVEVVETEEQDAVDFSEFEPLPDIAFDFVEVPSELNPSTTANAIYVFRVRSDEAVEGSEIFLKFQGGTDFISSGYQDVAAAGGKLLDSFASGVPNTVETGPTFEADNDDVEALLDLSTDTASWEAGRQVMRIGESMYYLRNVEIVAESAWAASTSYVAGDYVVPVSEDLGRRYKCISAGTSDSTEPADWPTTVGDTFVDGGVTWEVARRAYTLKGIIINQWGTAHEAHGIGKQIYIVDKTELVYITDPLIIAGQGLCVKSVPYVGDEQVEIDDVTEVCKTIVGVLDFGFIVDDSNGRVVDDTNNRLLTLSN